MAILLAVQQWRSYLQLGEFVIRTDHKSLTHLFDQRLHTVWQQNALTKLMGLQYKIVYKKEILNGVVDGLSRKPNPDSQVFSVSIVKPLWLERVALSYAQDNLVQRILQRKAFDEAAEPLFTYRDGLLCYQGRIWVGADV